MKKSILIFAMILMFSMMNAQHLKFMGFPINGTINDFTAKLGSKGFTISDENKDAGAGLRIFQGVFFDEDVDLFIHYTPSTKMVYDVRVCFWDRTASYCNILLEQIENMLKKKYSYTLRYDKTVGGDDITIHDIYDNNNVIVGSIYLIAVPVDSPNGNALYLVYQDKINSDKNDNQKFNDI